MPAEISQDGPQNWLWTKNLVYNDLITCLIEAAEEVFPQDPQPTPKQILSNAVPKIFSYPRETYLQLLNIARDLPVIGVYTLVPDQNGDPQIIEVNPLNLEHSLLYGCNVNKLPKLEDI